MKAVFVDTSGFYASLDDSDISCDAARRAFHRAELEQWQLFTSNYVVHETWALVQRRLGRDAVNELCDGLLPLCSVVWVDEALHEAGAARCRSVNERRFSLTDAVSLELLERRGVHVAIAFDEHFSRAGITLA